MNMIWSKKKLRKCPECGSWPVAGLLFGMPSMNALFKRDLEAGRIVLGGCVRTDNHPRWQCADCGTQMGKMVVSDLQIM